MDRVAESRRWDERASPVVGDPDCRQKAGTEACDPRNSQTLVIPPSMTRDGQDSGKKSLKLSELAAERVGFGPPYTRGKIYAAAQRERQIQLAARPRNQIYLNQ